MGGQVSWRLLCLPSTRHGCPVEEQRCEQLSFVDCGKCYFQNGRIPTNVFIPFQIQVPSEIRVAAALPVLSASVPSDILPGTSVGQV